MRLAVSTFTFTLLASGVVLLKAGFIQWCEHPCCSSISNAEIMTRPPYASWAMYCSMFPITMDLETEYSSFSTFQPYYFPALDATMDQRSLPMGYSFLGHEPDHLVCCDLPECAVRIQLNSPDEITYKRLNCGHSFHVTCLQPRGPVNGPFVPNRATCPICHPLLEERIRELSTTMNRWVLGFENNWILVCPSDKQL